MTKQLFLGEGFVLLPIRESVLNGDLARWTDADISALVTLSAHANRMGDAYPGWQRIATLAGLSKSSVGSALDHLEKSAWIEIRNGTRRRSYRIVLGEFSDSVTIWQKIVFSGLWAACTPAARKLYIIFRAISRPGPGDGDQHICNDEWPDAIEEGLSGNGCCHVLAGDAPPSKLGNLANLPERTRREAMERLFHLKLVQDSKDFDGGLVLPNNPDCYMPGVLEALERHDPAQSTSSPEAKRSATWRRRRAIHPAESVPIGGRRGMFPKEIDASPASSDSCDWLHPAEPAATTGG